MTERRVIIVRPWTRSNGQVMCFDTLAGYVVDEWVGTPRASRRLYLSLRIPIWPEPRNMLVVPADCVEDAPLAGTERAA